METNTKVFYTFMGVILPLLLIAIDIIYYNTAIFPLIWLFLWLGFAIFIVLPWTD